LLFPTMQVPFEYSWTCLKYDLAKTFSAPCFGENAGWTIDSAGNAVLTAGSLAGTVHYNTHDSTQVWGSHKHTYSYACIAIHAFTPILLYRYSNVLFMPYTYTCHTHICKLHIKMFKQQR
jgi:hypothetical protein